MLDNNCIMPGAVITEGATLGSLTLAAKNSTFSPYSISTGNKNGNAVLLRDRTDAELSGHFSFLPEKEREMVIEAHERNNSCTWFWSFNLFVIVFTFLFAPFNQVLVMAFFAHYGYMIGFFDEFGFFENWHFLLLGLLFLQATYFAETLLTIILKWTLVGKYKEGDHPFFTSYHYKWHMMMSLGAFEETVDEWIGGTVFYTWYLRAMGATIDSDDIVLFGGGLEYDLLHIGAQSTINELVDMTCHTVENMVIKLAPVTIGKGCTVRSGSVVMPGGLMETCSNLLDNSLVLKGEVVSAGCTFAGLPAEQVKYDPAPLNISS